MYAQYPHTQPEYTYPTYQAYSNPPGYLKIGYFIAKQKAGYSARMGVNPAYYYDSSNYRQHYYGPWYKPAPIIKPPYYIPHQSKKGYASIACTLSPFRLIPYHSLCFCLILLIAATPSESASCQTHIQQTLIKPLLLTAGLDMERLTAVVTEDPLTAGNYFVSCKLIE